ncbi:serine protease, S1-C subfamily, contains C-terminal PDZ domain [Pseudonocardia ammonioxydans]|uniref:Serine protease, S1-C subfamily, contains C-terminal PDZ domain n=1 Tax=Pseudonocardia ammonioxydans TaxID=260086 RepID=A0A1I5DZ42_PSUAM|nr:trypsin-like peptidase domain-containing protein [Pseudonocardia ammonioxydans]SFO04499.1 serine protease, S1-C subfamily, contains C-terminal PDZ domain [Pseudonocardia ammonioxydans]
MIPGRPPRRRRGPVLAGAVLVLLAAALTGCTTTAPARDGGASGDAAPAPEASAVEVVARLTPSVVTVRLPAGGLGSGVVLRPDVVVTNQHVVGDTRDVVIDYADGTSSPGTVLATDRISDIAVVRTARGGLPVPEYRTELPRPGEPVLAIGSPLGLEGTVTSGIVSAVNRQVPGSATGGAPLVDMIQIDAPISPGNSGGALLDASGRVIGINEAYLPPQSGAVALGFAIPAATAVDVAEQLLADGTASHPYLGLVPAPLTPQIRSALGVRAEEGALVARVDPDGPAAAAGIRPGDVLVALGDRPVTTVTDLHAALRGTEPGTATTVTVLRAGGRSELPVTIGDRPRS